MLVEKLLEIQAMLRVGNIEGAQRRVKHLLDFFSEGEQNQAAMNIMDRFREKRIQVRKESEIKKANSLRKRTN